MKRPKDEPYFVEAYHPACKTCNHGETWRVIGPDGPVEQLELHDPFSAIEDASEIAEALNEAYWRGRQSMKRKRRKS